MAKFNIEVELDWVDEETGYTIDEEIKEQVVSGVKDALLRKATDEAVQRVDKAIADKILEASRILSAIALSTLCTASSVAFLRSASLTPLTTCSLISSSIVYPVSSSTQSSSTSILNFAIIIRSFLLKNA